MRFFSPRIWILGLSVIGLGLTAQPSQCAFFTGNGTGSDSGNPLAASADFTYSGGVLTIVLTNTSAFDYNASSGNKAVPSDVLTGLFFDYNGGFGPSLTFNSATTPAITVGSNPSNLKLSSTPGGWDFNQSALAGITSQGASGGLTQHYGLGTAGMDVFAGGTSSGGTGNPTNFGIMNSLYVAGEGNPPVNGTPYAKDSITFSLSVGGSFDPNLISNVRFQYGTDLGEGDFGGGGGNLQIVPAPAGLILLASGLPVLGLCRLARRKAVAA